MTFKVIVVQIGDDPDYVARLTVAVELAQRFSAHLNVLYATEDIDFPAPVVGRAASMSFLEQIADVQRQHIKKIMATAENICRNLPSWEWHIEKRAHVERTAARYIHLADLVITEQPTEYFLDAIVSASLSDYLVWSAGGPLLIIPAGWSGDVVGKRILIAWKNKREAISAVRSALPFLREAEQVFVLADADDPHGDPIGGDLAAYLRHHGIASEVCGTTPKGSEDILAAAEAQSCDLIVMGASGHSSLREFIAGGSTNYVMRHTGIPLLMRY